MMRKIITICMISGLLFCHCQEDHTTRKTDVDKKVDELIGKMNLEEKIGQLNQFTNRWNMTGPAPGGEDEQEQMELIKKGYVGSMLNVMGVEAVRNAQKMAVENSRLGIPMIFGADVIHGYRTMFPIPLAVASSWDPSAAGTSARIAAVEASASGLNWTFAPMVDISRDARWGRIMEGAGEDPYLGSVMAAAQVHGFQGTDLNAENTIAACAKHFAAYGFVEAGRDYNTVDISEHTLRNVILPSFKACVDAGAVSFMNSFNEIGGVPSTANKHILRDILKGEWNFDGFVVSDWGSISEIQSHGVAANKKEAAYLAIEAGSDMDMEARCYLNHLKKLVDEGRVDESLIDDAVRRILKVKYKLGLFDDPYRYCNSDREKILLSEEHLKESRTVAKKSIVLLKNENELLPLKKSGQTIAVIGDLADDKDSPLGSWRLEAVPGSAVSLLEGIKNVTNDSNAVYFEQGPVFITNSSSFRVELTFNEKDKKGIAGAVSLAKKTDVVVLALGENCFQTGEGRSQAEIRLRGMQQQLLEEVFAVNKNVVVVLMNGRPLVIDWMAENVPAILETWYLGSEAGNAIADVLFGDYNPSGKLPVSFPRTVGQCPLYYNSKSTGRRSPSEAVFWSHYTDVSNKPLFPFGYGLSYTSFDYSDLKLSSKEIDKKGKLKISINIKNTGKYVGTEVVQLYVQDLFGSVTRPVKELKGFKRAELNPGESKVIEFELTAEDLAFYNADGVWTAEPGDFLLWVGTNSEEGLQSEFRLK